MLNPDPPGSPREHLDPDLLVGWVEGGLLEAEHATVERHLAFCDECRALAADLGPARTTTPPEEAPDPFAAPGVAVEPAPPPSREDEVVLRGHVGLWERRFRLAAIAATLLVLLTLLTKAWRDDRPRVEWLATAGSTEQLFGTQRSGTEDSKELFVGAQLDRDGHARLLAVLEGGAVLAVPLSTDGGMSHDLRAGARTEFGPYPRSLPGAAAGEARAVRWLLLVVSADPIEVGDEAAPWWFRIHDDLPVRTRQELEQLAVRIEDEHGAETAIVAVD